MQQRQLRLGDILDDYCPRDRRVTNHVVVAMVGQDVKQTRCTTCDADHEYKHAKVPRQRRKSETPALIAQVAAGGPKRVAHEQTPAVDESPVVPPEPANDEDAEGQTPSVVAAAPPEGGEVVAERDEESAGNEDVEEGPVHRPLIRATLPRPEGQPPPSRPAPDFTIRQPGRQNRFRPRHQRGGQGQQFFGNRSNGGNTGGGPMRSGSMSRQGGRPPQGTITGRPARHHGPGRKRSK